jgi:hypothetical protein
MARVHLACRRRGGMAAGSTRAAALDAGGRVSAQHIVRRLGAPLAVFRQGLRRGFSWGPLAWSGAVRSFFVARHATSGRSNVQNGKRAQITAQRNLIFVPQVDPASQAHVSDRPRHHPAINPLSSVPLVRCTGQARCAMQRAAERDFHQLNPFRAQLQQCY